SELRSIVHAEAELTVQPDVDVMELAGVGAGDGLDLLGPMPAWIAHDLADHQVAEPDRRAGAVGERLDLLGVVEALRVWDRWPLGSLHRATAWAGGGGPGCRSTRVS